MNEIVETTGFSWGRNTDTTPGTRFSAGKPKLLSAPGVGALAVRKFTTNNATGSVHRLAVNGATFALRLTTEQDPEDIAYAAHRALGALHRIEGGPDTTFPWLGMLEVGRVSEYGREKYALFDWLEGQSLSTLIDCGLRHALKAACDPMSRDKESGCLHLGHFAWNMLVALYFWDTDRWKEIDDVSGWHGVVTAEKAGVAEAIAATMADARETRLAGDT